MSLYGFFIDQTLWIYELLLAHNWISTIVWFTLSASSFILFHLQWTRFQDIDFFLENADVLDHFNRAVYKVYMIAFSSIPIFAIFVLSLSALELFNSRKFLTRFGCV